MKKYISLALALLILLSLFTVHGYEGTLYVESSAFTNMDDAVTIAKRKEIRMVGDVTWKSGIKDFYAAVFSLDGGGGTLKIESDISINAGCNIVFKNVLLDLGGKHFITVGAGGNVTLGSGAKVSGGAGSHGGAFSLGGDGASLTMQEGSGITGSKAKTAAAVAVGKGALLKLLGGTVTGNTSTDEAGGAIRAIKGSCVVLGGRASVTGNLSAGKESNIVITDADILRVREDYKGSAGITLSGGNEETKRFGQLDGETAGNRLFSDQDKTLTAVIARDGSLVWGDTAKANASDTGKNSESAPADEKLYEQTKNLTADDEKAASGGKAFKVGSKTYDDLGSAINDAGGKTVYLIADSEWNGAVKDFYQSTLNIDGNGFELKLPGVIYINQGSSLTLSNVTVDLGGKCFKAMGTGHITLGKGAVLKNGGADFAGALSAEGNGCTVTMKPGSIITGAKGKIGAGIATLTGANIELLGGVIENGTADSGGAVYIASGSKVTIGGDFTLKNNKSGGAEGGIEIADSGALTVTGEFTGSAGIKIPGAAGSKVGTETGGAKGTEKIYAIGTDLVVTTDGKGGLVLGKSGQSKVSDKSSITEEKEKEENTESIYYTDKSGWTASANTAAPGREASKAIDGNYSTYWHTEYGWEDNMVTWKTPLPHNLDIDFKEPLDISGFTLITNPTAPAGQPTKMQFFVKIDGEYKLVKEYKYNITSESYSQTVENKFNAAVRAEGVRLLYIDALDGHGTLAELEIMKPEEGMKAEPFDEFLATMGKNEFYPIPMSGATASYDGLNWSRTVPGNVLDGSISTSWQADPSENPPYNLVIDMGDVYTVNGFRYTTRQTKWFDGYWEKFNIWISDNGKDYTLLKENETFLPRTLATQDRLFGSEVTTRFFKFEILAGTGNLASLAEIEFLEDFDSYIKRRKEEEQYYTLKAGSKEMILKDGKKELSGAPYIENGTTFIPLRGLLEEMGASVEWNDYDRSVSIKKGNTEIYLQIRNKNVYVTSVKSGKERYTLASAPRITDSLTYIPLRFVSEMLGYTVEWNAETGEINIKN